MAMKSKTYARNLKCCKTRKFGLWISPDVRIVKCMGLKFFRHEATMKWQGIHIKYFRKNLLKSITWKAQEELGGNSES